MNKKTPLHYPTRERFTMHEPMQPNFSPPGSENWPRAVRPEVVQPTVVAGSPPPTAEPPVTPPPADG